MSTCLQKYESNELWSVRTLTCFVLVVVIKVLCVHLNLGLYGGSYVYFQRYKLSFTIEVTECRNGFGPNRRLYHSSSAAVELSLTVPIHFSLILTDVKHAIYSAGIHSHTLTQPLCSVCAKEQMLFGAHTETVSSQMNLLNISLRKNHHGHT